MATSIISAAARLLWSFQRPLSVRATPSAYVDRRRSRRYKNDVSRRHARDNFENHSGGVPCTHALCAYCGGPTCCVLSEMSFSSCARQAVGCGAIVLYLHPLTHPPPTGTTCRRSRRRQLSLRHANEFHFSPLIASSTNYRRYDIFSAFFRRTILYRSFPRLFRHSFFSNNALLKYAFKWQWNLFGFYVLILLCVCVDNIILIGKHCIV